MDEKMPAHGGNIYKKAKELHIPEADILDFSANVSPLGVPPRVREKMVEAMDGLIHYPDPECTLLREAIGKADGVLPSHVLCGNGGADLLFRMAFGLKPKKALLPVPAFVEYEEALRCAGAAAVYFCLGKDFRVTEELLHAMDGQQELLILCNPNNPTGLLVERELLLRVLQKAEKLHMKVLVDECFLDLFPGEKDYTLKPYLKQYPNLMILKSFTKLYAIPGVRLGYLLCSDRETLSRIGKCGQSWPVSSLAQAAGLGALAECNYKKRVVETVAKENRFMRKELEKLPIRLYDSVANYFFFCVPGDFGLDKRLEKYGIMIRNCSNYANLSNDHFRVAVKSHEENKKLLDALQKEL